MRKFSNIPDFRRYVSDSIGYFEEIHAYMVEAVVDEFWEKACDDSESYEDDEQEIFTFDDIDRIYQEVMLERSSIRYTAKDFGYKGDEWLMNLDTGSVDTAENWAKDANKWWAGEFTVEKQFSELVQVVYDEESEDWKKF